ncbi:PTS sugar transporter subunit IIB [Trinickia caryophylli]|uniref:PTS system, ascorbate-specific IIA component n=1 Tax=Trinickia caryophylli TaxID=28094 RepID=A0A1X7EPY2_TRICW|nr:PTS sugar transporter subunit IIB [Trinickia caryophylli]PMS10229.1 PTS sugar transporter subunit IIB [Trinickia caryophylli]TRX18698.1 PTS sugar transporter subunit IIB [Trinickia caryophylli]WQE10505.1 PTS sugar transporter subunit IIB [Trinickia caryophylli]SMF37826.1 PTS system, ascorbate-specific IIA component [Trinickia caryophylli]GLU32859.1 PTS fructose transporter subunit IIA [Trinickia caryophylli]
MAGILIIAHAPFASALRDCVAHIYGGVPAHIGVIDVLPDSDPTQVIAFAQAEIERLREANGALVLTDMYGATPANIASRLASLPDVRVLAGANLPMLVRAVCYRTAPLDALVDKALTGAANGVHAIGPQMSPSEGCSPAPCLPATGAPAATAAACAEAGTVLGAPLAGGRRAGP